MKKIFIAIMAVAAAVSCSQELTVDAPKGAAIAFDNAFVENSTRANDLTANNITDFGVYGFITNASGAGQIFNNQAVTKSGDAFTYSPAQYWVANATYDFAAIAPYANAHWTYAAEATAPKAGVLTFNNKDAAANQDLLYAYQTRTTGAEIKTAPEAVALTFDHLLSRVKFSFVNGFADGQNITLKVTDVNVENVITKGSIALTAGEGEWTVAEGVEPFNHAFGNAGDVLAATAKGTTEHFYFIPAETAYKVNFDVTIYQAGVELDTYARNATVTVALERGKSYELTATLNASNVSDDGNNSLYPIEFEVNKVNEWVDAPAVSAPLSGNISGQTLLTDATAANLELNGSFDGAGHTLVADTAAEWTIVGSTLRFINAKGDSSISNLTIDGQNLVVDGYGIRALFLNGEGEYTLDNVNIKNVTYVLNDDSKAKTLNVLNSTLQGWTSYNPATVARFENVAFVEGGAYNRVRPYGATIFKNCSFENTIIDLKYVQGDVKFVGCTYNGQPLVYANLTDAAGKNVAVDYVVTESPESNALVANSSVSNMTIDGGNYTTTDGKGLRAIYITKGGEYTVDNVVVRNVTYAINVNTTQAVKLDVTNSVLEGWTSWGNSTTASFENVKFECGKYANLKPYTNTTLTDCEFEAGFMIDFTSLNGVITFKNCKYNGVVITVENFAQIVKIDGDYTGKINF